MDGHSILINEPAGPRKSVPVEPETGWFLLGWAGWVFLIAGAADISLAWIPMHFGNPEWEFGTITRSFDALPLPFLGAALVMGSGAARGRMWWGRVAVIVFALFVLWVLFSGVVYALNVPLALRSVTQPLVLTGLKKAILRTSVQVLLYSVAASGMAWLGAKQFFGRGRHSSR